MEKHETWKAVTLIEIDDEFKNMKENLYESINGYICQIVQVMKLYFELRLSIYLPIKVSYRIITFSEGKNRGSLRQFAKQSN